MHSTNILNFFMLAVAAASAATISKAGDSKALQKVAEGKCDIGNTACCNNVHEEKDERLLNLVKQGLIDILAGNEDYACAKSGQTNDGPVCKNVTACCPSGKCVAIDGSAKKKESDKEDDNEGDNEGDDKEGDNEDDNEDDNQKDKRGDHDDYHHKGHKVDKDDKENKHEKDEEDHGRY
ncbi:unnamed protein product [Aspergillus oryzae]|nr:unnamed protein product [Aspergillus oryzae]